MRLIDADALIQSLEKKHAHWHELVTEENKEIEFAHSYALNVIRNAPTAEAKPTVIRSKTLLPTKDFMEWAKRIKEVNPNAVVIPCDAEVASSEAVHGWIPCSKRLPENTVEWKAYITCNEAGSICTTFWADGWNCSRTSDGEIIRDYEFKDIVAWMPTPEPYKEDDNEN